MKTDKSLNRDCCLAGLWAYYAGTARDDAPDDVLHCPNLLVSWQTGWDRGQFMAAYTCGSIGVAEAPCPYPNDPKAAAHWVKGWRTSHAFAVIHGGKKTR